MSNNYDYDLKVEIIQVGDVVNYRGGVSHDNMIVKNVFQRPSEKIFVSAQVVNIDDGIEICGILENFTKNVKKSLLRNDPLTIAVDDSNTIFNMRGLEVIVDRITTSTSEGTEIAYARYNGKLYTAKTIKILKEFESRVVEDVYEDPFL